MASKRMFTMKIVDSDAFLDMPLSSQCLYFHLNMRADDDGFVGNAKRIMRLVGASEDDLKVLIAKRFVLTFEDGVLVIKHWRMHNTLSQNRYHETQYIDEKSMLNLKENGSYTLSEGSKIDDSKLIESSNRQVRRTKDGQKTDSDIDKGLDIDIDIKKNNKKKVVYFEDNERLDNAFAEYVKMRKQIKAPMTDHAIKLAKKKLDNLSAGNDFVAIAILEQSIMNSWKGLFELKEGVSNGGGNSRSVDKSYEADENDPNVF